MTGDTRESEWFGSSEEDESYPCGCSMLSRIRLQPRNLQAFATMRCSLGYALRTDEDVTKCLEVEGPGECWKTAHNWRVAPAEPPQMAEQTRRQITAITDNGEPEEAMTSPPAETASQPSMVIEVVEVVQVTQVRITGTVDGND